MIGQDVVNTVIGDESFVRTFGRKPDAGTDETLRVRTHLAYVERLLRERPTPHLSERQRQTRETMLDLLRRYWIAGVFPSNTNPAYRGTRRPCFIDATGTICAVGYLIEQTAGRDVAESIDRRWHSAFVSQMVDPSIGEWIARSGLTVEDVAMIQPGYWEGYDEDEDRHLEWKREVQSGNAAGTLDEKIALLAQIHEHALLRSDFAFAALMRVELVELRKKMPSAKVPPPIMMPP